MRVARYREFEALPFRPSTQLFVLTGAGISAESGIKTFRDSNGLWEQYDVSQVASPSGWARDPGLVWRFYSQRRAQAREARPNAAHFALARLQAQWGNQVFLCTQNIDPLHEHAGSPAVIHMHGELFMSRCERDHAPPFIDEALYLDSENLPRCDCGARIRPHICWFGEVPFFMAEIERALSECNLMVTIGSSGSVYPAAGFVAAARANGAKTVYVGPERPENATAFDECRLGTATEVVPSLFKS